MQWSGWSGTDDELPLCRAQLPAMSESRELLEEAITRSIIGALFAVYRELGPRRLEHVYVRALELELRWRAHRVGREVRVPVFYRGFPIATERLDLIVDERVVVEVKSTDTLPAVAVRQLQGYLRSTNLEVGLVLHFGPDKASFRRVICDNARKTPRSTGRGAASTSMAPAEETATEGGL